MKLSSVNLQGFESWETRKPYILNFLREQNADIVLFQEVVFLPEISPFNPAQLLNQELGYLSEHSVISRLQIGIDHPVYREGLAIISKHPIVKSDIVSLQKDPEDECQRFIQLVDISIDETIVKLAHVHFSVTDFTDYATPQLKETLDIIKNRGETRIIAGDFNLEFLEQRAELWQEDYIASTDVPYATFPSWKPHGKRVDYFLIPKTYQFDSIVTSDESLDDLISDHRALTVTISPAVEPLVAEATSRTQSLAFRE